MKPHKRPGRKARLRRQEAAKARKQPTPEQRLLLNIFGKEEAPK